jgi:hypothetical protein
VSSVYRCRDDKHERGLNSRWKKAAERERMAAYPPRQRLGEGVAEPATSILGTEERRHRFPDRTGQVEKGVTERNGESDRDQRRVTQKPVQIGTHTRNLTSRASGLTLTLPQGPFPNTRPGENLDSLSVGVRPRER